MERRTKAVVLLVALVAGVPALTWLAAPLFLTTRANTPAPAGFTEVVKEGTWHGQDDFHFAEGRAAILGNGEGDYILRLDAFRVRNGPDIEFFLSVDGAFQAGDVALGDVPATEGSYHVAIPRGTDVGAIRFALVQCVPFNVLFATAELA
jgi:hypothetical protein